MYVPFEQSISSSRYGHAYPSTLDAVDLHDARRQLDGSPGASQVVGSPALDLQRRVFGRLLLDLPRKRLQGFMHFASMEGPGARPRS